MKVPAQKAKSGNDDLETRLRGTRPGHIVQELFTNTAHFPIANIFFELLLEKKALNYFREPDVYILITAALIQAYFIGSWQHKKTPRPFLGNLISPASYTVVESSMEGLFEFFASPAHIAFWSFAISIGLLQELRTHLSDRLAKVPILLENLVRTSILLVMYGIFEAASSKYQPYTISRFLSDPSHVFMVVVILLLGLMVGFANLTMQSYLTILRHTASQLRRYSEWLLGRDKLSFAVKDPDALKLQRQERTLIFMDIRGFTQWSETQPPEAIVSMLNAYFEAAEKTWTNSPAIMTKHTADEIMLVFPAPLDAAAAAIELHRETVTFLQKYALSAGIGLHSGPLVEGLIGSKEVKGYDVIGDTVNTAKRICEAANGGEILISQNVYNALGNRAIVKESRQLSVKGKTAPLSVYSLKTLS